MGWFYIPVTVGASGFFPTQNLPVTGFDAGGGMAGFAQLGIVVCLVGGGQGNLQGMMVGAGCWTRGSDPCVIW